MHKYFLNIIFFVVLSSQVTGQQQLVKARFYSQKEGLSSYNVIRVTQDKYGFIWAGTQDGLNCFDGRNFDIFNKNTVNPANGSDVKTILYDRENNLIWAAFSYGGISAIDCRNRKLIYSINEKSFSQATQSPNLKSIWLTRENKLAVATEQSCFLYDFLSGKVKNIFSLTSSIPGVPGIETVADDQHYIYLFLGNTGIVVIDKQTHNTIRKISRFSNSTASLESRFIRKVMEHEGNIYFSCSAGIGHISPDLSCSLDYATALPLSSFSFDKKGTLWAADNYTVFPVLSQSRKGAALVFGGNANIPGHQYYLDIFFDNVGNLWTGTSEGLLCSDLNAPAFISHSSDPVTRKKINHLYDILPGDSMIYLNDLKGLLRMSFSPDKLEAIDTSAFPFYLLKLPGGDILYNNEKGFFAVNGLTLNQSAILRKYPELSAVRSRLISCHVFLSDSVVVLGGEDFKGLIVWDFVHHRIREIAPVAANGWADNAVNMVTKKDAEHIYVCQDKSLGICDIATGRIINYKLTIGGTDTARLYFDLIAGEKLNIIASYGYGVFITDKDFHVLKVINSTNGLSNNGIYRMLMDESGNVWASTNNGLNQINMSTYAVNSYYESDGLCSNSFEEMSAAKSGGYLYFGGKDGFTEIKTGNLLQKNGKPELYLVSYTLNTGSTDTTITDIEKDRIVLGTDVLQSTIRYASLDYMGTGKTKYYYQIEELQNDWVENDNHNFVTILRLPPGTYHLKIKALNDADISSDVRRITFVFLPKWYQTWWFRALIVALIIGIVWAFYQLRINQLKKEQRIRIKLASDLHDDLGSTMNSVKVYANLAMMEYPDGKYPPLIKHSTQEAITGIRDMIWVLDDSKDTIDDLLTRISNFAVPVCDANGIVFQLSCSDNARSTRLAQEERRNLYMMIKEALNNAIKYAGGKRIAISITQQKSKPRFEITDEGAGFDSTAATEGNGLRNMKRRAAEINYRLVVSSQPGKGTIVSLEKN